MIIQESENFRLVAWVYVNAEEGYCPLSTVNGEPAPDRITLETKQCSKNTNTWQIMAEFNCRYYYAFSALLNDVCYICENKLDNTNSVIKYVKNAVSNIDDAVAEGDPLNKTHFDDLKSTVDALLKVIYGL